MARYQADDEPLYFRPHIPGKIVISRAWFIVICAFGGLGAATVLMMLLGV
jgi:hypothetical protein